MTKFCSICKESLSANCGFRRICLSCGIQATDNKTGQKFFFYDEVQSHAENAMCLMGYGCSDYSFSYFSNRPQPTDENGCECSCHCGGFDGSGVCKQPCDDCQCPD